MTFLKCSVTTNVVVNFNCQQYGPNVDNDGQFILDNDWPRSACLRTARVKIDTRVVISPVARTKKEQVIGGKFAW